MCSSNHFKTKDANTKYFVMFDLGGLHEISGCQNLVYIANGSLCLLTGVCSKLAFALIQGSEVYRA